MNTVSWSWAAWPNRVSAAVPQRMAAALGLAGAMRLALRSLATDKEADALPATAVEAAVLYRFPKAPSAHGRASAGFATRT